jgi:hypothetical protein
VAVTTGFVVLEVEMEVISAWELYLWTRLDGIISLLSGWTTFAIIVLALGVIFCAIGRVMCASWLVDYPSDTIVKKRLYFCDAFFKSKLVWIGGVFVVVLSILTAFIPTKKDVAIIFILPKIANNQTIQQEAGEIYSIAKEALRELVPAKDD